LAPIIVDFAISTAARVLVKQGIKYAGKYVVKKIAKKLANKAGKEAAKNLSKKVKRRGKKKLYRWNKSSRSNGFKIIWKYTKK